MVQEFHLDRLVVKWARRISQIIGTPCGPFQKIIRAKEVDDLVGKVLSVLRQRGIYAAVLFLLSSSGEKLEREGGRIARARATDMESEEMIACHVTASLINLLWDAGLFLEQRKVLDSPPESASYIAWDQINGQKEEILKFFLDHVTDNLDRLFLIRDIYEKTLIHARFEAKAAAAREGYGKEGWSLAGEERIS